MHWLIEPAVHWLTYFFTLNELAHLNELIKSFDIIYNLIFIFCRITVMVSLDPLWSRLVLVMITVTASWITVTAMVIQSASHTQSHDHDHGHTVLAMITLPVTYTVTVSHLVSNKVTWSLSESLGSHLVSHLVSCTVAWSLSQSLGQSLR